MPQIGLGPPLPGCPSRVATTARRRDHADRRVITGRIRNGRVEIPIEPPAALYPLPAGSFPEGFRTTAPVLVHRLVMGPSSETLYMKTSYRHQG
jgi:hypothetical protein